MNGQDAVIQRMQAFINTWENLGDRRVIFLSCYLLMSEKMLQSIQAGVFEDNAWVQALLDRFAEYYFTALEAFDRQQTSLPLPWGLAFTSASKPHSHVLQDLILGINAHINYDLVFALVDQLSAEWAGLTPEQRLSRYHDHCHVNEIIFQTIDSVQDQVVDHYAPIFGLVDKLLGPLDEWVTVEVLSEWREEVWKEATFYLELAEELEREAARKKVEQRSVERARTLLGEGGLKGLVDLV